MIGNKKDAGKNNGYLHSKDDVAEPQEVTTWQDGYYPKCDIIVTDILNSKSFIKVI